MIIVKLMGGLGNQMFQYACGKALALKHETELYLDHSFLEDKTVRPGLTLREYELDVFKLEAGRATEKELSNFLPHSKVKALRKIEKVWRSKLLHYPVLNEKFNAVYEPRVEQSGANVYLNGFWQTEKYFKGVEKAIRTDFQFKNQLSGKNAEVASKMISGNSVSIHVRRGDYVNCQQTNSYHGTCSVEYYHRAIAWLSEQLDEVEFFVFSDDLDWVKGNVRIPQATYIDWNQGKDSYLDMQLMSLCKHNVIANSSFSWWGAWLNPSLGKRVIVPQRWFQDEQANRNAKDLIPESWIRL